MARFLCFRLRRFYRRHGFLAREQGVLRCSILTFLPFRRQTELNVECLSHKQGRGFWSYLHA